MKTGILTGAVAVACAAMCIGPGSSAYAQSTPPATTMTAKETTMAHEARGTFDVKLNPLKDEALDGAGLGSMSIAKQFHGDLEGTSVGQMLTAMSAVEGSGAYVAVEKVTGTLGGRKGTFMLQHMGTMDRGVPKLSVTVVPDSGTDELVGLTGTFEIIIADGKHSYVFYYSIAAAH